MPIRPLTHRDKRNGELYHRRPEVEAQIAATLNLSADELVRRAEITDAHDPNFLRDETLVYHLREAARADDHQRFNRLWEPFGARSAGYALRQLKSLPPSDVEDAQAEFAEALLKLVMAKDDRGDYCEVSYQQFVKRRATDIYNQKITHNNRSARDLRISEERDYDENGTSHYGTTVLTSGWNEDTILNKLLIKQLYRELEKHFAGDLRPYQAWRLRLQGMPIGPAGSPGTIATRFGVSDRTIRNWLGKVEEFLVEWRKRNSR